MRVVGGWFGCSRSKRSRLLSLEFVVVIYFKLIYAIDDTVAWNSEEIRHGRQLEGYVLATQNLS